MWQDAAVERPAAKDGDTVVAVDTHILMVPSPAGPVPTPTPMPFQGALRQSLCDSVLIENKPAATEGSVALNDPPHVPTAGPFQQPPSNQATVASGSETVLIANKKAARTGDTATTCDDFGAQKAGVVTGSGSVFID